MALDASERMLIEQRVANDSKNIVVAYLLLIFLGLLGAHRFYLGRAGTGVVMLILTITFFGMIISGIWAFVDLFLVPGMVNADKERIRNKLTMEALAAGGDGSAASGAPTSSKDAAAEGTSGEDQPQG